MAQRHSKPANQHSGLKGGVANVHSKPANQVGSNSWDRILPRLARDAPEILEKVRTGEIKSARAAAIEAGIIIPFPSLQLKDPAPTAEKLLAKKGKEWCTRLMQVAEYFAKPYMTLS